jgi:hypothetical protein
MEVEENNFDHEKLSDHGQEEANPAATTTAEVDSTSLKYPKLKLAWNEEKVEKISEEVGEGEEEEEEEVEWILGGEPPDVVSHQVACNMHRDKAEEYDTTLEGEKRPKYFTVCRKKECQLVGNDGNGSCMWNSLLQYINDDNSFSFSDEEVRVYLEAFISFLLDYLQTMEIKDAWRYCALLGFELSAQDPKSADSMKAEMERSIRATLRPRLWQHAALYKAIAIFHGMVISLYECIGDKLVETQRYCP